MGDQEDMLLDAIDDEIQTILDRPLTSKTLLELEQTARASRKLLAVREAHARSATFEQVAEPFTMIGMTKLLEMVTPGSPLFEHIKAAFGAFKPKTPPHEDMPNQPYCAEGTCTQCDERRKNAS